MALHLFNHEEMDYKAESVITKQEIDRIHPDLKDLVWIADGPYQNYDFQPYVLCGDIKGYQYEIEISKLEQSLIFTGLPLEGDEPPLPVEKVKDDYYIRLKPENRKMFWSVLENPYGLQAQHEYMFMLLHGLERHLVAGDCLAAARCVFELRKFVGFRGFRSLTANGLMMTAMLRNNRIIAEEFLDTFTPYYYYDLSADLYIMMMYGLDVPVTPERLMVLYKNFGYSVFRSVRIRNLRQFGDIYLLELEKEFEKRFGSQEIQLKDYISQEEYLSFPQITVPVFSSAAIDTHEFAVPEITKASAFQDFTKLVEEVDERARDSRIKMYQKFELTDEARKSVKYMDYHKN